MSNTTSPGAFAKALQEQRRRRNRRKLLGAVVGVLVLLLGGLGVWLLWFSDALAAKDVQVRGTTLLDEQQVVEVAAVPLGKPLVSVDLQQVQERVKDLVQVAAVEVSRDYPSTVTINVTERSMVYQRVVGERYEWVDARGVVFHTTDVPQAGRVIANTSGDDPRLLADVATVVKHLPDSVSARVVELDARGVDEIVITLTDGDTVAWGSADESELKAEVLEVLLEQVEADVYDVSAPAYPTTR